MNTQLTEMADRPTDRRSNVDRCRAGCNGRRLIDDDDIIASRRMSIIVVVRSPIARRRCTLSDHDGDMVASLRVGRTFPSGVVVMDCITAGSDGPALTGWSTAKWQADYRVAVLGSHVYVDADQETASHRHRSDEEGGRNGYGMNHAVSPTSFGHFRRSTRHQRRLQNPANRGNHIDCLPTAWSHRLSSIPQTNRS